ncbi:hypothetical protein BDV93DRAFT_267427 [Ceratobasidium sp. AG-I]|nr:hypothetical protein BDV93DRAFT_267427 [Ceratobasidium sp. AG-I]
MNAKQDHGLESLSLDSYHGDSVVDWVNELLDLVLPNAPTDPSSVITGNVGDLGNLDKAIVNMIARFDVIAQETASRLDTIIAFRCYPSALECSELPQMTGAIHPPSSPLGTLAETRAFVKTPDRDQINREDRGLPYYFRRMRYPSLLR